MLFQRLSQRKVWRFGSIYSDFWPYFHRACAETAILADIYWAGLLLSEIIMILFTQSTVVIRKIFDRTNIILFVIIFPKVAQNSLRIP